MKQCKDCAHFKECVSREWGYCELHLITVKREFEPCEKFRLKEQHKEEVGRP